MTKSAKGMLRTIILSLGNKEVYEMYLSNGIRSLAFSMLGIFVPIYFYQLGYSLSEIFTYLIIVNIIHAIFTPITGKLISTFGPKHIMFVSIPLYVSFYIMLNTLPTHLWPLGALAVIFSLGRILYYHAYHVDMALSLENGKQGRQLGIANIFYAVTSAIGPLIGGLLLTFVGFSIVFVIAISLLVFSAVPMFFTKDMYSSNPFSIRNFFKKKDIRENIVFSASGFEGALGYVIWPIVLFIFIINGYAQLGFITSISIVFSLVASFIIGNLSDKKPITLLRLGASINFVVWLARLFARNIFYVFITDSVYGLSRTMIWIPYDKESYKRGSQQSIITYIGRREFWISIGRIILFTTLLIVPNFNVSFVLGAVISLVYLLF